MNHFRINNYDVTNFSRPYIIAEIGVNHEGSFDKAKELIELAKEGGAQAAKFQSYKAETLASKNSPSYWDLSKENNTSQYNLFKKYDNFEFDEYQKLAEFCKEIDIDFLSTAFDEASVKYLKELMPVYKIASADITNLHLIKQIANTGKPVILSTGASNINEINNAISILEKSESYSIALLHCILNYPTLNKNASLNMIKSLVTKFPDRIIGYSDHTLPDEDMTSLTTAYILGARIIEKHFTDDKSQIGNDHYHAMDLKDLKRFNQKLEDVIGLMGEIYEKKAIETEFISIKNARRSIVLKRALASKSTIKEEDIICKRPGTGISPMDWNKIIGKQINKDLDEDHILHWEDIDN